MANNNECALSQISGYTSNSNSTNNFDLKEIEGIELNRVTYGADLSERLEDINENFNKIIESDFLRGAPGRSISISTWVFNDETKETPMGQSLIDAIMSNNADTPESDALRLSIEDALTNKEIKVIHDEDGNIVSSLPFTFIDTRFYDRKTLNESLANETDLSCVLVYETTTKSSGFAAAQTFPTLYWDTNIGGGDFCWKINGQKTGLPCKGPQGNDGGGGTLYTVIYNADPEAESNASNGSQAREIIGAMWLNSSNVTDIKNEFIPESDFGLKQISIKTGDTVIALPGVIGDDNKIHFAKPSNSSIGTTVTDDKNSYEYSITTAFVTDDKYYIVISGDTIHIPYILEAGVLQQLLQDIGEKHMLGLYIPSSKNSDGSVKTAHTLWSSKDDDNNYLNIGEIKNVSIIEGSSTKPDYTTEAHNVFSTHYDEILVGRGDDKFSISTSNIGVNSFDVDMRPLVKASKTVESYTFSGFYLRNLPRTSQGGSRTGVISGQYDLATPLYKYDDDKTYSFSIYQRVKINNEYEYVTRLYCDDYAQKFIFWDDINQFISFLNLWIESVDNKDLSPNMDVNIGVINRLYIDDYGEWVADYITEKVNESIDIYYDRVTEKPEYVTCKKITADKNDTLFKYELFDSKGEMIEMESLLLTAKDSCGTSVPFALPSIYSTRTGSIIEDAFIVDSLKSTTNVQDVLELAVEDMFDVIPSREKRRYLGSAFYGKLSNHFHRYEGVFTQSYAVKTPEYTIDTNSCEVSSDVVNFKSNEITLGIEQDPDKSTIISQFFGREINAAICEEGYDATLDGKDCWFLEYPIVSCRVINGQESYNTYASIFTRTDEYPAMILFAPTKQELINFYRKFSSKSSSSTFKMYPDGNFQKNSVTNNQLALFYGSPLWSVDGVGITINYNVGQAKTENFVVQNLLKTHDQLFKRELNYKYLNLGIIWKTNYSNHEDERFYSRWMSHTQPPMDDTEDIKYIILKNIKTGVYKLLVGTDIGGWSSRTINGFETYNTNEESMNYNACSINEGVFEGVTKIKDNWLQPISGTTYQLRSQLIENDAKTINNDCLTHETVCDSFIINGFDIAPHIETLIQMAQNYQK